MCINKLPRIIIIHIFLTASLFSSSGLIFHISSSGSDFNNGSEESPFATIQAGINAASDGDTVLVYPGNYVENLQLNNKDIILGSLFMIDNDISFQNSTIIDGNQNGRVIEVSNSNSLINGFTITNGRAQYINGGWDTYGGGVLVHTNDTLTLNSLIFKNNYAYYGGGAIAAMGGMVNINNCIIYDNTVDTETSEVTYAGALFSQTPTFITNSLFYDNYGRGSSQIYTVNSELSMINSTVVSNSWEYTLLGRWGTVQLKNNIFHTNQDGQEGIYGQSANISVEYSLLNFDYDGIGNINANPLFLDTSLDDYRLSEYSPAIGAGNETGAPSIDLNGNPRPNPSNSSPDIGAYENNLGTKKNRIIYVNQTGSGGASGFQSHPINTIQTAIDASNDGDTILVAPGIYTENINFKGKNIIVASLMLTTSDTSFISSTIIDGSNIGSVVVFNNNETDNARLNGFTIRNGLTSGTAVQSGGGITCVGSSPRLENLIVTNNHADTEPSAGGIFLKYSNATIKNCVIKENTNQYYGGGVHFKNSSNSTLINSKIYKNEANEKGGALLFTYSSNPVIKNTIIYDNESYNGSICTIFNSNPSFFNCTIVNNKSENNGNVDIEENCSVSIVNSILYNNEPLEIYPHTNVSGNPGQITVGSSIIDGGYFGENNLSTNPLFMDIDNNNFRLSDFSPAIGSGNPEIDLSYDINYNTRPAPEGSNPDLGAYENNLGVKKNRIIYVNQTGNDGGSGFQNQPLSTIQAAINISSNGDTISVAQDTYYENLVIDKSIYILGENPYSTIIDGSSNGSVLKINSNSNGLIKLEGFTIQNGSGSTDTYSDNYIASEQLVGGGIVSISNELILRNVVFQNNSAEYGGGIFSHNSNIDISNVDFMNNEATNGQGGAIWSYVDDGIFKAVSIDSSTVSQNTSTHRGAGLAFVRGNVELKNTQIANNSTPQSGGGVYIAQLIDGLINNCIISGNSASQGGGIFSTGGFNGSDCTIKNSLFFENTANEGSAIKLFVSDIDLINCTIVDNISGSGLGQNSGHIFIHHSPSELNVVNTIISNDAEYEIISAYPSSSDGQDNIIINHSMISGGNSFQLSSNTNLNWGEGNIDVDPLFIDQENNDYGLLATSPLINSGNPSTQFLINDMVADIGYFQYNIVENQSKWYVSLDGNISTASGSNSDPFSSIQAAINFASNDDSIFISNGMYAENVKFRSSAIHLIGEDKINTIIDGSNTGSVISIVEPNSGNSSIKNLTIKNGSGTLDGWPGVNGPVGGGIFAKYNNVSLNNLILRENSATYGGGVFIQTNEGVGADLKIIDVNFENNSASGESSAAWIRPTNVTLEIKNSTFASNSGPTAANISGGDLNVKLTNNIFSQNSGHLNLYGSGNNSSFELLNNYFVGNSSNQNGGALLLDGSNYSVTIESCIFSENLANSAGGGGVAMKNGGSVNIRNSLFYKNEALDGGAIMCNIPNTTIYNTTMVNNVDNQFSLDASAILIHTNNESFEMLNSIVWNNKIVLDDYNQGNINIDYSNIHGGLDSIFISDNNNGLLSYGINNLNVDPMFVDLNNDNYHLNQYSQLIGAGTLIPQLQNDIEGSIRPFPEGSSPDIGAYEHISGSPYVNFTPTISSISDTTIFEDAGNIMRLLYGITDGSQSENDSIFVFATTTNSNVKDLSINYNYPDNFANISFSFEDDSSGLAEIFIVVKDDGGTLNDAIDSALTSFTLNVLPVNDAPVITAISDTSFYEDDSLVIALSAFDVDNDSLSFYEPYDQNYVSIIGDTLILNAAENWNGQFWSYIHVSDGELYDSTEFMVDIIPVNDAPTIAELNDTTMLEDGFLKLEFNSHDVDGDTLNYEAWSDKDFGQIQIDLSGNSSDYEHDSLLITPHPNWFGNAEIYVRVFDNALSDTIDFTLEVESVDDLPVADMPFADVTLYEDSPDTTLGNLDSLFTDIDGELEFSVSIGDTNLIDVTINDNLALMHITPNAFGSTDIIFIATNPTRAMVKDTVMVEILPINDPPTIDAIADTTILEDSGQLIINLSGISSGAFNEDQELTISATFSDSTILGNIGPHNYYYNSPDSVGAVELFTNINIFGSTDVKIEVHDNAGDSVSTQFTVNVEPVNDAPQLETISFQTIEEDSIASVNIVASDIENDYLTFSAISDTISVETFMYGDSLVLVPLPDWNGETYITVTASDGELIDTTYFSLHVIPVDDEPVITFNILDLFLEEDFSDTVLAHLDTVFNDIDGSLTYSFNISDTSVFRANISSGGILELNANQDVYGEAQLVIIASNQARASVSDTIEVIIESVNDTPEFVSELNALVGAGIEFHKEIDTYDADMEQLTLSFNSQQAVPDWLTLNENIISGIPPINGDFSLLLDLSDNDTTITDTFYLFVEFFHPVITSIVDVPEDQGGWVYLGFNASYFDSEGETGQEYGVYRYDTYEDTSAWVMVTSGPAIHQDHYVFEVHTSRDSTEENNGISMYKVVASMNEGVFHSPPDSGYSIDNIAPGVPTGMQAIAMENSISLTWDISEAEDFQYFVLERSNEATLDIADTTIFYELIESSFEDLNLVRNVDYSYRLAAYDYAGNRSEFSEPVSAILLSTDPLSLTPEVFALHQNYPNPFNPTTQIRYDLPESEFVNVIIYDVMGRKIKSLINKIQEAGYRSISWDATNDLDQPVSAGMYIYTIQAGEYRQTKKMILLK